MALTRDFKATVKDRADRDPEFRRELLKEALEAVVNGEPELGRILLRDYINATEGFEKVGAALAKSPKSLMRMLSRDGNPNMRNLLEVTRYLQKQAGVTYQLVATTPGKRTKREPVR